MTWAEILLAIFGVISAGALAWQNIRKGEVGVREKEAKAEQNEQKWIAAEHRKVSERIREEWGRLIQDIQEKHTRCEERSVVQSQQIAEQHEQILKQREQIAELERRIHALELQS